MGKLADEVKEQLGGKVETTTAKRKTSYKVEVSILTLNIRKGPRTNFERAGKFAGKGTFTITETKKGKGSDAGWGKLKSGTGWMSLDYAKRIWPNVLPEGLALEIWLVLDGEIIDKVGALC